MMAMGRPVLAALIASALAACFVEPTEADRIGGSPTVIDWNLSTTQIKESCKSQLGAARARLAALSKAPGPYTFANTVLAFENALSDVGDNLTAQTFLSQVAPDKSVRDVSLQCSTDLSAFFTDVTSDPALYAHMVAASKTMAGADVQDRALAKLWIVQFEQSGSNLPPAKRTEFVSLSKQLTDAQNTFDQNFANDTTTIQVSSTDAAGLPADFLSNLKTVPGGGYVVPVNDSTAQLFLTSDKSADARRRFVLAYGNIQASTNVPILQHEIELRDRLAHLMGFPDWAAYQMRTRTVQDPSKIVAFLQQLDAHVLPLAKNDVAKLNALKAKETGDPGAVIEPGDFSYYLGELQRSEYALDQNEVRQYFPAPQTVKAILNFYQHILGVTFAPITPANAWSPDVTEFSVTDTQSGRLIGSFYLDLYPRPGKPGGAFNAPIIAVRRMSDGLYRPPVSAMIVSDWPAPSKDKPALLSHDDVVTFFHEFGHCMAAVLANVKYESLSSFNSDFVEAPSQMLENFAWDRSILHSITSNVDTGAPMPDALISKILAARCLTDRLCNGYAATRQLMLSIIDLDYHMSGPKVDTDAVWAKVAREDTPIPMTPGVHPEAQFTHLSEGYDAGYYVYLWSLVYAQDMFTAFEQGGVDNPEVGMRYRKTILEPARSSSPDDEVKRFLGRPMSTDAFYRGFDGNR